MVNVVIAGFPINLRIGTFLEILQRDVFQEKIKVSVNYIRQYTHKLKMLSLNMTANDARKAIRYLNGYDYTVRGINYSLLCWKEDTEDRSDSDDVYETPSKRSRTSPFDEPDELEVINRKIELIRKQRILLEEESQLLLEKERLEMVQNLGQNDLRKLSQLEEMCESNQSVSETNVSEINTKGQFKRSPYLKGPWRIIHETMKGVINAYIDEQDRPICIDLLRSKVKYRLALVLKNKGKLTPKEMLALYRSIYPENTDISLIQEVLMKINKNIYPINMVTECDVGEENEQINPTDRVDAQWDSEDVEKTGLNDSQNEKVVCYKDVNPDFDDNIILDKKTTEKALGLERNQCTDKEINYENINVNQFEINITDTDRENEIYKTQKKIHLNECKENETNEISQETLLNINKEISINKFARVNTNKEIESAFNEVFDMDNDLDDWVEDEKDDQQVFKAAN